MAKKINKVLTTQPVPLTSEEVQNLGLTLSAVLERTILPTEALWIPSVTDVGILSWRLGTAGDPGPSDVNIRGAQGIQGAQGPQGPQGDQGEQGEQGERGDTGPCPRISPTTKNWMVNEGGSWIDTGMSSSGAVGPRGPEGQQGPAGPDGPRGLGLSAQVHPITGGNEVSIWKETGTQEETHFDVMDGKDISAKAYPVTGGGKVEFWKDGASEKHAELFLASGTSGYTPRAEIKDIDNGHRVYFYLPDLGNYDTPAAQLAVFDVMNGSTAGALGIIGDTGIEAVRQGDRYEVRISGDCYIDTLSAQSAVNAGHAAFADLAQSAAIAEVASKYYSSDLSQPMGIGDALDGIWNCVSALPGDSTHRAFPVYAEYAQSAYLGPSTVSSFPQFKTAIDENKSAIQANATEIGKKIETVNHDATLSGDGKTTPLGLINAYKAAIETVSGKVNANPGTGSENHDFLWHINQDGSGNWTEAQTWIANRFDPINGLSGYGDATNGKYYVGVNTSAMTQDKRYGYRKGFGWFMDPIQWVNEINGTYDGNQNYQHMMGDTLKFYKTMIHPAGTTSSESWANDNIIHIILEA